MSETTRRILKHVFSIPLARQLNFAGRGEKSGIGKTDTCGVIIRKSIIIWLLENSLKSLFKKLVKLGI